MKVKPTPKNGGVVVELGPEETQIPAQAIDKPSVFRLQRILVPVDFSECSNKALRYAFPFAKQFGAELALLAVVERYPQVPEMAPIDYENVREMRTKLQKLRQSVPSSIATKTSLRTGNPASEIVEAARDLNADLIIMSTHGRTGITRLMLGSTTERVVRHASCPVLIVRESERDFVTCDSKP